MSNTNRNVISFDDVETPQEELTALRESVRRYLTADPVREDVYGLYCGLCDALKITPESPPSDHAILTALRQRAERGEAAAGDMAWAIATTLTEWQLSERLPSSTLNHLRHSLKAHESAQLAAAVLAAVEALVVRHEAIYDIGQITWETPQLQAVIDAGYARRAALKG